MIKNKNLIFVFGFIQGQRLYENQSVSLPMSKSIRCLKLNVRSALEILLQHNTIDQDERLKRNTTQFFLPIIRKCLNVQVQDRLRLILIILTHIIDKFECNNQSSEWAEYRADYNSNIRVPNKDSG